MSSSSYEKFVDRYQRGDVPWDDILPPPEVVELAAGLPPGRALDLGCGYGRTAVFLAQAGWQVDGVDFVPQAVEEARRRAEAAGAAEKARFFEGSVTDLHFLPGEYDVAVDIGCLHNLPDEMLPIYYQTLCQLLRPGAVFLLFACLRQETEEEPLADGRPRGVRQADVMTIWGEAFTLEESRIGTTQVEDKPPWTSGWFWFRYMGQKSHWVG